jgi:chemotaxis response regulator CheB
MPQQAIRTGAVDQVLSLGDIATAIQLGVEGVKARVSSRKGLV